MKLLAVRSARLIAHLSGEELNPKGRPIAHDFLRAFVERYKFVKWPTTAEEILDAQNKGITFETGKLAEIGITKVILHDWGVIVDTNTSTEASDAVLNDMLKWGAETFGLSNRPDLISQRAYVSEVIFSAEISLSLLNPRLAEFGTRITDLVAGHRGDSLPYEVIGFGFGIDPSKTKQFTTGFRIERLADAAFSLNKYYSGAPLKTSDHLEMINSLALHLLAEGAGLPLDLELP